MSDDPTDEGAAPTHEASDSQRPKSAYNADAVVTERRGRGSRSWLRTLGLAAAGGLAGGGLALLLAALLFRAGLAPPRVRAPLTLSSYALLPWFIVLGGVIAAKGRWLLAGLERVALPAHADPGVKWIFAIAAVMAIAAMTHYHVVGFLFQAPSDLPSFLMAARAMAAGADFYDLDALQTFAYERQGDQRVFPYLYLPLYAVFFRPLAAVPLATVHGLFLILNALLWPLLIYLCLRLIEAPDRLKTPLTALVLLIVPSFLPTIQTLHHGSPSLLVAVLVVAVLLLEREGRSRLAGALLALVVLIKIVPLLLVPYLLLRRRFGILIWAGIAALALLGLSVAVAGVEAHVHWLTQMAPSLSFGAHTGSAWQPGCHPENQSFTGLFCRLFGIGEGFELWASAASVALVLVAAFALWRRRSREIDGLEGSLVVVTILLVSTITWFHHMTMMLLPALSLIAIGAESVRSRGGLAVLLIGAVVLVAVGFEFYLDPWPFVAPNPLSRTIRFQAMMLAFVTLVVVILRGARMKRTGE